MIYGKAFATNSVGTAYGEIVSARVEMCLAEGTLITLHDRSFKSIENITYCDELLVWDFDNGVFSSAKPLWIKCPETSLSYNLLKFSKGSKYLYLKTIGQHRIYNNTTQSFTYPINTDIGTHTFIDSPYSELLSKEIITGIPIKYYNIITDKHINLFANGILTSCRYNNIYPIKDMKFCANNNKRHLRLHDLHDLRIPKKYYSGLRLDEQNIPIDVTVKYIERMEKFKMCNKYIFLDHQGVMYTGEYLRKGQIKDFDTDNVIALKSLLDKYPDVDIVVSSDWKDRMTLKEMQQFYVRQGLKQPIDYTPKLPKDNRLTTFTRSEEIKSWLTKRNPYSTNIWVAIDDLDMRPYYDFRSDYGYSQGK